LTAPKTTRKDFALGTGRTQGTALIVCNLDEHDAEPLIIVLLESTRRTGISFFESTSDRDNI
jgi:hypothetical protein